MQKNHTGANCNYEAECPKHLKFAYYKMVSKGKSPQTFLFWQKSPKSSSLRDQIQHKKVSFLMVGRWQVKKKVASKT